MKRIGKLISGLLVVAAVALLETVALTSYAGSPTYTTLSAGGNPATPANVSFVADPARQVRIVSVWYQGDTNNAVLQFSSGSGAYAMVATNAATTTVTNVINTTAGLAASATMCLEHLGVNYYATLSSTNNGTNLVLNSGGWGVLPSVGDSVYQMGTVTQIPVGSVTNALNGDAIFVGDYGRPVRVVLTPCGATNRLNSVGARYD